MFAAGIATDLGDRHCALHEIVRGVGECGSTKKGGPPPPPSSRLRQEPFQKQRTVAQDGPLVRGLVLQIWRIRNYREARLATAQRDWLALILLRNSANVALQNTSYISKAIWRND